MSKKSWDSPNTSIVVRILNLRAIWRAHKKRMLSILTASVFYLFILLLFSSCCLFLHLCDHSLISLAGLFLFLLFFALLFLFVLDIRKTLAVHFLDQLVIFHKLLFPVTVGRISSVINKIRILL